MVDEKHQLHDWEKKNIFVRDRKSSVGQLVSETILTLRRYLIDQKIQSLVKKTQVVEEGNNAAVLEDIMSYQGLKKLLSLKLNRVL